MRPPLEQKLSSVEQRVLSKAIEALDERELKRVQNVGGYPGYATNAISGYVLYVTLSHDEEPELEIFTVKELISWYKRARALQREDPGFDIVSAMYETQEDE